VGSEGTTPSTSAPLGRRRTQHMHTYPIDVSVSPSSAASSTANRAMPSVLGAGEKRAAHAARLEAR